MTDRARRDTDAPTTVPSEDLGRLAAMAATGRPVPAPDRRPPTAVRKLLLAGLIAGVGVGASIMSCVGQSFSYRQARALEGIEQQLQQINATCSPHTSPPSPR